MEKEPLRISWISIALDASRPFGLFPIEVRLIQIRTSSDQTQSQFNKMIFRNLNEEYSASRV